jgi:hypothetical protein
VGLVLSKVRYVDLDYGRSDHAPEHRGPRTIVDETEWQDPTWRYDGFDAIDHGIEFETSDGRVFSVTWDSPGRTEGIGLRELPLIGHAVVADADVAAWDVTEHSGWTDAIGEPIRDVVLHYFPWQSPYASGFWCPRLTIDVNGGPFYLLLGEAHMPDLTLRASSDNIAVVFPPNGVPEWELAAER